MGTEHWEEVAWVRQKLLLALTPGTTQEKN